MTMSVLKMSHQRESLPLHAIAPGPHAGDVVTAQWTVDGNCMVLNFFGSLVSFHTSSPLTQKWFLSINLYTWGRRRTGGRLRLGQGHIWSWLCWRWLGGMLDNRRLSLNYRRLGGLLGNWSPGLFSSGSIHLGNIIRITFIICSINLR